MARLPQPGSDSGTWGDILNEYLAQAHNTDGSLKPRVQTTKTSAYILGSGDAGSVVVMSTAAATTVTIPADATVAFAAETTIVVRQGSTGQVVVQGAGGVSLRSPSGITSTGSQNVSLVLTKLATNEWLVESTAPAPYLLLQKYVTGRSIYTRQHFANTTDNATLEGDMVGMPIVVQTRQRFDALTCRLFNAGTAGALVRLGLYADDGSENPGALLADAGTFDGTDFTTEHALAINVTLDPGLYWVACAWQNTGSPPTTKAQLLGTRGRIDGPGVWTRRLNDPAYWLPLRSGVSGALPATFSPNGDWRTPYRIGMRVGA